MTADDIIATVSQVTGIPVKEITGPRRTARIAWARFLAIEAISLKFPWWSRGDVAAAVGRRDHATTLHALATVEGRAAQSPENSAQRDEVLKKTRFA